MTVPGPDRAFWDQRFQEGNTPWDRGAANPQLDAWLASGALKPCRILVPGCGAGYEVVALARAGFDVTALDYSPEAITLARENLYRAGLIAALVEADALDWLPARPFEAIYEQTCLCALYPDHWRAYGDQLHRWLKPGGKLYALFVQYLRPGSSEGSISGPPYHCDINAMRALFPSSLWDWPKPPYVQVPHPRLQHELALTLTRR